MSAASDSTLKIWYDATAEVENEAVGKREQFVLREQEMLNAYRRGMHARAMTIALEIDQPLRLRGLLEKLVQEGTLEKYVSQVTFTPLTLTRLFLYIRDWNTNSRFCGIAQATLSYILTVFSFDDIRRSVREANANHSEEIIETTGEHVVSLSDLVAGLTAYSDRHLKRATNIFQSSFLVEYTLRSMQKLLPQGQLEAPATTVESDTAENDSDDDEVNTSDTAATTTSTALVTTATADESQNTDDTSQPNDNRPTRRRRRRRKK